MRNIITLKMANKLSTIYKESKRLCNWTKRFMVLLTTKISKNVRQNSHFLLEISICRKCRYLRSNLRHSGLTRKIKSLADRKRIMMLNKLGILKLKTDMLNNNNLQSSISQKKKRKPNPNYS